MNHVRSRDRLKSLLALCSLLVLGPGIAAACGDDGDDGEPSDSATLPRTAFVYVKFVRSSVGHIYSHDLATGKSTLITKLDDDGTTGTASPQIAMSPDRRWIAFRALFRPNDKDKADGLAKPSIWKVSVDGKHFARVTDPLPNPNNITCTTDAQCVKPMTCILSLKRCAPKHFTIGLSAPTWSADNKTIWTALSQTWTSGSSIAGGAVLASVPATGGALQTYYQGNTGCALTIYPAAHPKEGSIAAIHSVCSGGVPGLYKYGMPPTAKPARMFSSSTVGVEQGPVAWMPDGSVIYFSASAMWDLDNDGTAETQGSGIVGLQIKDSKLGGLLPPLKTGSLYSGIAIAPSGTQMAACIFDSNAQTYKIYLLDSSNTKTPFSELITDGKSCNPSW